ncbi:hypothetical protein pb186bvf_007870 [Paramecium bursaria]
MYSNFTQARLQIQLVKTINLLEVTYQIRNQMRLSSQNNQINMDFVLKDNKNIESYVQKLKLNEQDIRKFLEYFHTYINHIYPECVEIEQLYSEFDLDGIGFLNEDQIFFLFLVLIMNEQSIDKINILQIFEQFYLSIQQKGKLTLRGFKRFFLEQDYNVKYVIQDIIKIPDIRSDLASEIKGSLEQNVILMKITYDSLLSSRLNNHIIDKYKEKIHYYLDLFQSYINPKQKQQDLHQIELNLQDRNDFVFKNYQNAIQKLINQNQESQKIIFSDSVKSQQKEENILEMIYILQNIFNIKLIIYNLLIIYDLINDDHGDFDQQSLLSNLSIRRKVKVSNNYSTICNEIPCSISDYINNPYLYGMSELGDFVATPFTLCFYIRINPTYASSFIFNIIDSSSVEQIYLNYVNPNTFDLQPVNYQISGFSTTSWLQICLTQTDIYISDYDLTQNYMLGVALQNTFQFNLFMFTPMKNWIGQACCIIFYSGVNIGSTTIADGTAPYNYFNQVNFKKPELIIHLNVQEKIQSKLTTDYSDYQFIAKLGGQFNHQSDDPVLDSGLKLGNNQFIQIDNVPLYRYATWEFRIRVNGVFNQQIKLMDFKFSSSRYISVLMDSFTIQLEVDGDDTVFSYQAGPIIHFSIGFLQLLEESAWYYQIFYTQYSDIDIIQGPQIGLKIFSLFSPIYPNQGILFISSPDNQFETNSYFTLLIFRYYQGHYLEISSIFDSHCKIYLSDRCIICLPPKLLSDKNQCIISCDTAQYVTVYNNDYQQCIRKCHTICATCADASPEICLTCFGMRAAPPDCACPAGYFDDLVHPDCKKYIADNSVEIGETLIYCSSAPSLKQTQITTKNKYQIPPKVQVFLKGFGFVQSNQLIKLYVQDVQNDQFNTFFYIMTECSNAQQFYKVQWICEPGQHLSNIQQFEYHPALGDGQVIQTFDLVDIQKDIPLANQNMIGSITGWQFQGLVQAQIEYYNNPTDFQFQTLSTFDRITYNQLQTDYGSFNYREQLNTRYQTLLLLQNIPKNIQYAHILQSFTMNVLTNSIYEKSRTINTITLGIQLYVGVMQGQLLFAAHKCYDQFQPCNFYESYQLLCQSYSLCRCDQIGYFVDQSYRCQKCDPNCYQCSQNPTQCTTCSPDTNKQIIDGICQCAFNYYEDNNGICGLCDQTCFTCQGSSQSDCLSCKLNAYLQNGQCSCNQGYKQDQYYNCIICTIQDYINQICSSCQLGQKLVSYQCQCAEGYFSNDSQCLQCMDYCKTCVNYYQCVECPSTRVLNTKYYCVCQQGYYQNNYNIQCLCIYYILLRNIECLSNCLTCSNGLTCDSCYQDQVFDINGLCVCDNCYYKIQNNCFQCRMNDQFLYQECQNQNCLIQDIQCNDYNDVSRDGCYNNKIEIYYGCYNNLCFKCPSNCQKCSLINNQIICDLCDDNYYKNQYQCIQCNDPFCKKCTSKSVCIQCLNNNIPIDNSCLNCNNTIGLYSTKNGCISICGDSIKSSTEECDDGNTLSYDGCSDSCVIENNFICLEQQKMSYCKQDNKANLILSQNNQLTSNKYQIQLKLDKKTYYKQIQLTISIYQDTILIESSFYEFKYNYTQQNKFQYLQINTTLEFKQSFDYVFINFNLTGSFFNEYLLVTNLDKNQTILYLENIQVLSELEKQLLSTAKIATQASLLAFCSIGIIQLLIGNFTSFLSFLNVINQLYYMIFININYPVNFIEYLNLFNSFNIMVLIDCINILQINSIDLPYQQPDEIFQDQGVNSYFLINIQPYVNSLLLYICIFQINKFTFQLIYRYQEYILKLKYYFRNHFIVRKYLTKIIIQIIKVKNEKAFPQIVKITQGLSYNIIFAIFLQLRFSISYSWFELLGYICSIITLFTYFYLLQVKIQIQNEEYKDIKYIQVIIQNFNLIKPILFMMSLVFLTNFPLLQLITISSTQLIYGFYFMKTLPLNCNFQNYEIILQEFTFALTYFTFILYIYQPIQIDNTIIGWCQILILSLMIILTLFLEIYLVIKDIMKIFAQPTQSTQKTQIVY